MEMYFPACLLPNRYAIGGLVVCFSFFVHLFFAVPPKRMSVHPGVFFLFAEPSPFPCLAAPVKVVTNAF